MTDADPRDAVVAAARAYYLAEQAECKAVMDAQKALDVETLCLRQERATALASAIVATKASMVAAQNLREALQAVEKKAGTEAPAS